MAVTEKVVITGDSSGAVRAAKVMQAALGTAFLKAQLGATALTKVTALLADTLRQGVQSAIEYQKTTQALSVALKVQGQDVKRSTALLEAQSTVLERLTGIAQEEIRTLQTRAFNLGVNVDRIDDVVRASITLANVTGQGVNEAFRSLISSTNGVANETLVLVDGVKQLTKEQLKSGEAIKLVNAQYGEFIDLNTRGGAGQITQLATAWGNLGKAIARAAIETETFKETFSDLTDLALVAQKQAESGDLLGSVLTTLFGGIVPGTTEQIKALAASYRELEESTSFLKGRGADGSDRIKRGGGGGGGIEIEPIVVQQLTGPRQSLATLNEGQFTSIQQGIADRRAAIAQSNAERMADIAISESERVRAVYDEQGKMLLAEQQDRNRLFAQGAMQVANITASFITGALETLLEGGDFSEFVKGFLQATGQQLIASGIQHALQGAAFAFVPGFQASAGGLAAVGAAEIAAGTAMMAGQLAIPAAAKASGGGATAAPSFGGGASSSGIGSGGGGGDRNITIVFNGPTTKPEVGLAIREALAEADAVGV